MRFKEELKLIKNRVAGLTEGNLMLIKGSGQSFLIKSISLFLGYALQVLLARILGVSEFGIYIYVLTWINLLTLPGKLGLDHVSKKFIPVYYQQNKLAELKSFIKYSRIRTFVFSSIIALLIVITTYIFFDNSNRDLLIVFCIGSVVLIFNVQLHINGSFLEAFKKIYAGLFPLNILRPVLIIIGLLFLYMWQKETAAWAMSFNILATFVAMVVVYYYSEKIIPKANSAYSSKSEWLKTALPLLMISGAHMVLTQIDVILIGLITTTSDAGIYNTASKISQLGLFGLMAINIIAAPLISEYYGKKDFSGLQKMISLSALLTAALTLPVIIIIAIIARFILQIFGLEFTTGTLSLRILLIGQLVNAFTGSVSFVMTMTKFHMQSLYILIGAVILNLILNLLLIPLYGIEGAAFATAFTTVFWNIGMYIYVKKRLNIDSSLIWFLKNNND